MTQIDINGHMVGIVLRDLVRRALLIGRKHRGIFEAIGKESYGGDKDDFFTNADKEAQDMYVRLLQECFPDFGIIGEEDELVIEGKYGLDAYFTIDPIDGTKAYIRRQSHGIGSMIALVINGEVVSAYIGDMNTGEIFGYRPGTDNVWRIDIASEYREKLLPPPTDTPLCLRYIQLRNREEEYSQVAQATIKCFENVTVDGGSIGTWAARLWKNEVAALILPPSFETPWDSTPVIGIAQKLGYVFLESIDRPAEWMLIEELKVPTEKFRRNHDLMIIHRDLLPQLRALVPIGRKMIVRVPRTPQERGPAQ